MVASYCNKRGNLEKRDIDNEWEKDRFFVVYGGQNNETGFRKGCRFQLQFKVVTVIYMNFEKTFFGVKCEQ